MKAFRALIVEAIALHDPEHRRGAYNKAKLTPTRIKMMHEWATLIDNLLNDVNSTAILNGY